MNLTLVDRSGNTYPPALHRWRGDDGSPLHIEPGPGLRRSDIITSDLSMWRYRAALPAWPTPVSLGEGCTPLIKVDDDVPFFVKAEWANPTSSFKDRGVSTMLSALTAQGATHILEDSSGNAGSSVAAYASAAGIEATIVVPALTSAEKIEQIAAFGAGLVRVEGSRDDVAAEAIRRSATVAYASHNWNPFFLQGIKTIGYEIWENLGFELPDNVVTVAGSGSIALGLELAFSELRSSGEVTRTPRIFIGQPEGWDPIVAAIHGKVYAPTTYACLAEGASISSPVRGKEVARAVTHSGGTGVSVNDAEIARSTKFLMSRGLFAEPTSAVAHAAHSRLLASGAINATQQTVVVLTGTGLKARDATRKALALANGRPLGSTDV